MYTAYYTEEPEPLTTEKVNGYTHITLAINPVKLESDGGQEKWRATADDFWVPTGELDIDAVRAQPALFIDYATEASKRAARRTVQTWNDAMFGTTARIEIPDLWAIEYTPKAVTFVSAIASAVPLGLSGSISWTDADDVRHDNISLDQFKLIAGAIKKHVDSIQAKADAAREAIRNATTNADVQAALDLLEA